MATTPAGAPLALLLHAIDRAQQGARAEAVEIAAKAEAAAQDAASVLVATAQIRFACGDREGAIAAIDRVIARGPEKAGVALAYKALFLRKQGRLAAALAVLDELAKHEGHTVSAHAFAAEIRAAARDDDRAIDHLDRAIAAGGASAEVLMEKAAILARLDRTGEAREAVASAIATQPGSAPLALDAGVRFMHLGAFDDAERALAIASADARTRPEALAHRGRLRLWWGDVEAASTLADEALRADPELALGLCLRGAIHVLCGEHAAAVALLDRAVAHDDPLGEAFVWRAEARSHLGDRAAAVDDLERATWGCGDWFAAHVIRLLLAVRAAPRGTRVSAYAHESVIAGVAALLPDAVEGLVGGQPEVIAPLLERTLAALRGNRSPTITCVREGRLVRMPAPVTARFAAKWAQERVQVAPLAEVLDRFDAVMREHARSSKPYCYRGELRLWVGDLAGARDDFERARAEDPTTKWAYIGLCATAMLEGRYDEALAVSARGLALTGVGPSLFVYRGETHRRRGDLDAAAADLDRACRLNPSRVSAWVNLALLQGARGDREGQRTTMERLRWQAPSLLDDAARSLPSPSPSPASTDDLLDRCLSMMRGNRSSSCITYFAGDELCVVPFVARKEDHDLGRMLAALRDALVRRARR